VAEKVRALLVLLVQELAEGLIEPLVCVVAKHVLVQAAWVVEMVGLGPAARRVWDILALAMAGVV
jgi:hypothetical protein